MATTDGQPAAGLRQRDIVAEILRDPYAHDFFAALRHLQVDAGKPAVGTAERPGEEDLRLLQEPSLAFASSTVSGARWREERRRLEVLLRFTGLLGPNGPMPIHLTEYVIDRKRHHDDTTLEAFLNLFHHRIYSLFFRAWALNHPAVDFDRPDERRHSFYLRSLIGLGTEGTTERDSVPDASRLFFSGWLGGLSRSPEGLASILTGFLGVPTQVENFQGVWMDLPPESKCRLGASRETGTLGSTCFAGDRVWLTHLKFRLRFGPLTSAQVERLLPGGSAHQQIVHWIRHYIGEEFTWDALLVLKRTEIPPCRLGGGVRLGWTTWTGTPAGAGDIEDLVLQAPR